MKKVIFTNKFFLLSTLIIVGVWAGCTALIDFVIVRTVFTEIRDFFEAGRLGLSLFNQFNYLEFFLSLLILGFQIPFISQFKKNDYLNLLLVILLVSITFFYFFYLTPKLTQISYLWESHELSQTATQRDFQQEHQFFHTLYRFIDSLKLFLLIILELLLFRKLLRSHQ